MALLLSLRVHTRYAVVTQYYHPPISRPLKNIDGPSNVGWSSNRQKIPRVHVFTRLSWRLGLFRATLSIKRYDMIADTTTLTCCSWVISH